MARTLNRLKFSVVSAIPLGVRAWDAAAMLAISEESFERCRMAGWIKPAVEGHALVIYDRADVEKLWDRIKQNGLPTKEQWSKPLPSPSLSAA